MDDFYKGLKPTIVSRDAGYSKLKVISHKNREEALKRVKDPNIVTGIWGIKELFAEIGIVVHPERLTMWYKYTK